MATLAHTYRWPVLLPSDSFPDFPGCITAGKTLEEEGYGGRGFARPPCGDPGGCLANPRTLDARTVMQHPDYADSLALIPIEPPVTAAAE